MQVEENHMFPYIFFAFMIAAIVFLIFGDATHTLIVVLAKRLEQSKQ